MKKILDKVFRIIDHALSGTLGKQVLFFLIITVVVLLIFITASILFFSLSAANEDFNSRFWNIVSNFVEPSVIYDSYRSNFERFFIMIANLAGKVLFIGILIALLTNSIFQRIDKVKKGNISYNFSGHFVIIGYNNISEELIRQLATSHEVVLQTARDVELVRQALFTKLNREHKKKVTIVSGSMTLHEDLKKLNIDKCLEVFLIGDINESDHDSKNMECLGIINEASSEAGKNIRCHVLFGNRSLFTAFQQQEIPGVRSNLDFVPFDYNEMWAQKVFVGNSYNNGEIIYKTLDHEPITADSSKRVHLVILGMSDMGIALGMQAAHICHFPNFITKGIKTRITFIDGNVDIEMNTLKNRLFYFFEEIDYTYQCFNDKVQFKSTAGKDIFTDIEFEFIKAGFEDHAVRHYLEEATLEENSFLTIAVALPDPSVALTTALYLPAAVYDNDTSVLVRQEHTYAIVSMLSQDVDGTLYRKYTNLRPFGMYSNCYDLKQADDILPMMIKYTYDNTSDENFVKVFPESEIRRNWIENWRKTDIVSALKASCRYAANFIPVKQRSLDIKEGIDLDSWQINLAARMEHNRWVVEKLLLGFRAPTPEEAASITKENRAYYKERFIHEDIKAYQELGEDDRVVNVNRYDINISNSLPYMIKAYRNIMLSASNNQHFSRS